MLNANPVTCALIALFTCSAIILGGCFNTEGIDDALNEYRVRLSRVLDIPFQPIEYSINLHYPTQSELTAATTEIKINLQDFYAIQECQLGNMVAERNTTLGKIQLPSQRLVYEHKILNMLIQCERTLAKIDHPLAQTVPRWHELKQTQYQQAWRTLVEKSSEMKLALSVPNTLLRANDNRDASGAVNALHYLNSLSNPSSPLDTETLETQLHLIESSRLPAKMWATQQRMSIHLSSLTTTLRPALEQVSCKNGIPEEKAKILRNVFYLFFIQKIQPVGSRLNQYHYKLMPLWHQWMDSDTLSPSFKQYVHHHALYQFARYQDALSEHVELWQQFLARCNLSPQATTQ